MATTTTWGSTCSREGAHRRSRLAAGVWRASMFGGSANLGRPPTGACSAPRLDLIGLVPAPGVERVIERGLEPNLQVVLGAVRHRESVRDGLQSGRLRRQRDVGRDICAVNDPRHSLERRIMELVLDEERLEAAAAVDVAQLDAGHVKR